MPKQSLSSHRYHKVRIGIHKVRDNMVDNSEVFAYELYDVERTIARFPFIVYNSRPEQSIKNAQYAMSTLKETLLRLGAFVVNLDDFEPACKHCGSTALSLLSYDENITECLGCGTETTHIEYYVDGLQSIDINKLARRLDEPWQS